MTDPFSVATGAIALAGMAAKLTKTILDFVREVRAARSDLDALSRELGSLQLILANIEDDFSEASVTAIPGTLRDQVVDIIRNCQRVLQDIETVLGKQKGSRLGEAGSWALRGKDDVHKLAGSLTAYRSALSLALDCANL